MDASGFDALTRSFRHLRSRRGVTQGLLAALLGATSLLPLLDEAEAKRNKHRQRRNRRDRRRDRQERSGEAQSERKKGKKKRKPCPPCRKRKQGKCKGKSPDGAACPGGSCRGGSCVPTPVCVPSCGERVCGGNDGCGQSCGACTDGLTCQDGQCVSTCAPGLTDCSGNCVDLQADTANCGTCGTECSFPHATATCQDGACTLGTCDAGWDTCDGDPENGCETNLLHDLSHCGACGNACDRATQICNGSGACVACDVCADGCPFNSIQAAITAAAPGDTIRVCAGTWVLSSTLIVEKDLILVGAGDDETILDGNEAVRVLTIGGSDLVGTPIVAVRNLTITRGFATGIPENNWGGGLFNHGTLTLSNVIVTENFADFAGGIQNRGALDLVDSRVTVNTTKFSGAGIGNSGSAGSGTLTLLRSTVQDNTAGWQEWSGDGGGINNYLGTVTIEESQVTGNTAHSGGGIFNQGQGTFNSATVTLKNGSLVVDNFGHFGGGIRNGFGTVIMENGSRVEGNRAGVGGGIDNTGRVSLDPGSKVTGNAAETLGGGIDSRGSNPQSGVTLAATDIVTENYLTDGTTLSNCTPVNTIPNCIG
jgi:hypothetical protein